MRYLTTIVLASLVFFSHLESGELRAAEALRVLQGDGITLRVLKLSEDETEASGILLRSDGSYPFVARLVSDDNAAVYKGQFRVGKEEKQFTTTVREGDPDIIFSLAGRQYHLRELAPVTDEEEEQTSAPGELEGDSAEPPPAAESAGARSPAKPADEVRLHQVEIRDVNMNNVVAYTMLVPDGWDFQGHVEWSKEKTPYPQRVVKVTASDGSWINFSPAMSFSYSVIRQVGGGTMRNGTPPPSSLGEWVVSAAARAHPELSEFSLISDERDRLLEQASEAAQRQSGIPVQGNWEKHRIKFRFLMDGVPFTEELHLTYSVSQVPPNQWVATTIWMVFVDSNVRAPSARFEEMKPLLYASANSLRTVPQWFTQQQLLLMEITKQNHVIGMEEIRRRGQYYDQLSDASFAAWKKSQLSSDRQQNARINSINEVDDFRDSNGLPVKLPIHYKNYYSDGRGNYLMTNSTLDKPDSSWTELEPMK